MARRAPNAAEQKFLDDRTRALVRSQRPRLAQFWGAAPPVPPPLNTTAPVASGTPTVGNVLSVSNGAWSNSPTSYAYRWLRNGANITLNAQASTYTLVAADAGTNCSCRVTATNASGSTPAVSNALAVS